jgi:hypothetical protein
MRLIATLRDAILRAEKDGRTYYRIAKDAGVDWRIVSEFASGERENMTAPTMQRLCDYLGLELRPVESPSAPTEQTSRKRGAKSGQATGKRGAGRAAGGRKRRRGASSGGG